MRKPTIDEKARIIFMMSRGFKCEDCGETDIRVLEIHHKESERYDKKIPYYQRRLWHLKRVKDYTIPQKWNELMLVCSNCHSKRHSRQKNLSEFLGDKELMASIEVKLKEILNL